MIKVAEVTGRQILDKLEEQDKILQEILIHAEKTNGTVKTQGRILEDTRQDFLEYKKGVAKVFAACVASGTVIVIAIIGWILASGI